MLLRGGGDFGTPDGSCWPVAAGPHIYSASVIPDGGGATIWVDGQSLCTFGPSCFANGGTLPCLGTPAFDEIGVRGLSSGYQNSDGVVAEMLVYSNALSDSDRQGVEAYLAAKYRLP